MKQTNLDSLNTHLFETIEMLKNNNDPKASDNEKIDVETAKIISGLAKVIVEGFKVRANVLSILTDAAVQGDKTFSNAKELAESWGVEK